MYYINGAVGRRRGRAGKIVARPRHDVTGSYLIVNESLGTLATWSRNFKSFSASQLFFSADQTVERLVASSLVLLCKPILSADGKTQQAEACGR